jgi:hypothetical protein
MKIPILFLLLLNCAHVYGKNNSHSDTSKYKKGVNNFIISYTTQQFLDKKSLIYDNKSPNNHLYAHNAKGGYWSFMYERTTKNSFIWGGGIVYGTRNYRLGIDLDVSGYDPMASQNLEGKRFQRHFNFDVNYFAPKIVLGYKLPIKEKWSLTLKTGIAIRCFFDGLNPNTVDFRNFIEYVNANGNLVSRQIGYIESDIGRQNDYTNNKRYFPNKDWNFDFYFGIDRVLKYKWLQSLSVGIELGSALGTASIYGTGAFEVATIDKFDNSSYSYDHYLDKNKYLGIRFTTQIGK